jgi:catechol 2,3-dioxygenase-like lactoylglutathione lyase family enzyme
MHLGCFSLSLSVKDLAASRRFYEQLGFEAMGDFSAQGWMILKQGDTVIGLFQGMFEGNMLTFNPGWSQAATPLDTFMDVREIQARLVAGGVTPSVAADPDGTGPAHIVVTDPDGNRILIDQHVPRPR